MFNKGFSDIEELKRFKELKKLGKVHYTAAFSTSLNKFFALNILSFKTFV